MKHSHIALIGAPMDLGAGRRGVDMGPSALRVANLNARLKQLGYEVEDRGNVSVVQPETEPEGDARAKYLPQITDTCEQIAELVALALKDGKFPLVLGEIIPSPWVRCRAFRNISTSGASRSGCCGSMRTPI